MTQVDLSAPPSLGHEQPAERAGRMCPVDYRYPASVFDRPAELTADTLYVAGGLYGNLAALDEIERLAAQERAPRWCSTAIFTGSMPNPTGSPRSRAGSRVITRSAATSKPN